MPFAAALLLANPALSGAVADQHLNASAATLALGLTPVVAAVAAAASTPGGEMAGLLWPGLAGITGLLLLLPQPNLFSWRIDVALATMPLVAGVAATFISAQRIFVQDGSEGSEESQSLWMERGLLLAAVQFSLLLFRGAHSRGDLAFSWLGSLADGLLSLLALWILGLAGALRWSAQFLLIPLVTILEGVALLRPALTARSWVGLALLIVGGGYLLIPRFKE